MRPRTPDVNPTPAVTTREPFNPLGGLIESISSLIPSVESIKNSLPSLPSLPDVSSWFESPRSPDYATSAEQQNAERFGRKTALRSSAPLPPQEPIARRTQSPKPTYNNSSPTTSVSVGFELPPLDAYTSLLKLLIIWGILLYIWATSYKGNEEKFSYFY